MGLPNLANNRKKQASIVAAAIAISFSFSFSPVFADDDDDLLSLSLEDLLNMDVYIASGDKALTARESPGIVSVVTMDEIKSSGARDLIDILRLVPGFEFGDDIYHTQFGISTIND